MYLGGVVEIAAGVVVALKPRYGAYLVVAWLAGIIVNLLALSVAASSRPGRLLNGLPGPLRRLAAWGNRVSHSRLQLVARWQSVERIGESGDMESRQSVLVDEPVVESSEAGARWLGIMYWDAVSRSTRRAVRATWGQGGGRLRLLGGATLLRFGAPELHHADGLVSCRYAIDGGVLALQAGGSVTLAQRAVDSAYELSVTVDQYVPRLAARVGAPPWTGVLYVKGQGPFHEAVSRRYFDLVQRGGA
jgi:hypothetical protein